MNVFSAHFYKKLTELGNRRGRKRPGGLPGADAHELVARWTKDIDIFSKKYVFPLVIFAPHMLHRLTLFRVLYVHAPS